MLAKAYGGTIFGAGMEPQQITQQAIVVEPPNIGRPQFESFSEMNAFERESIDELPWDALRADLAALGPFVHVSAEYRGSVYLGDTYIEDGMTRGEIIATISASPRDPHGPPVVYASNRPFTMHVQRYPRGEYGSSTILGGRTYSADEIVQTIRLLVKGIEIGKSIATK